MQGDDLVHAVLGNMEAGQLRIRRKTLVPSIYRIYLHPDDHAVFRKVETFVKSEIRDALDERLAEWNGSKLKFAKVFLEKIGAADAVENGEFIRGATDWTVEIHADLDGKIPPGEIEIYSELGTPEKTEPGAGSLTRRIFASRPESAPAPTPSQPPPQSAPDAGDEDRTKGRCFAHITYVDPSGPKTFEVTKNLTVIGRGGRSYWVDLRLETLTDVSREHCRIRKNADNDGFTLEDVSQFGTSVNGRLVGKDQSVELPEAATISLAGVVELEWTLV